MRGLDAKFLYSETPTAHMHTLKVAVLDASPMRDGFSFEALVDYLDSRLDRLPPFRRRVVPVPLSLGHPVWIEDPEFDIRRHVQLRKVDPPGGDRDLAAVVQEVAGHPLPRDRPLWELTVVEGLAGGRVGVVAKIHHAVADGATSVALMLQVLTEAGGGAGSDADADAGAAPAPWHPEPIPSRLRLLRMALAEHRPRLRGLPSLVSRSVRGFREAAARRRAAKVRPPLPLATPRTPLNVSLTAERTFAMTTVPLADLKLVRHAFDTTLNDVFVAVCGGALRRYLEDTGALPRRPLVASVPLATAPSLPRRGGNYVDNLYVSAATDVDDPVARLRAVSASARSAKEVRAALGTDLMEQRAEVVPPQLYSLTIRAWTRSKLADHLPPPVNVVLSNVAGPPETVGVEGMAVLEAIYSVGPILEGIGCNITAWSYAGKLHVSVLGCPRSLPDPWPLVAALHVSLAELTQAARDSGAPVPAPVA